MKKHLYDLARGTLFCVQEEPNGAKVCIPIGSKEAHAKTIYRLNNIDGMYSNVTIIKPSHENEVTGDTVHFAAWTLVTSLPLIADTKLQITPMEF